MISRGGHTLSLTALALVIGGLLIWAFRSTLLDEEEPEVPKVSRTLNDFLTNEMSDSLALDYIDKEMETYLSFWHIKGVSLTITRNDSLVYSKGFGWADKEKGERMTPGTIMRLASVSKLITAAGIMKLQEMGKLSLGDRVFGPLGILNDQVFTDALTDPNYLKVTVEHLLRHQAGFSTRRGDPLFSTVTVMQQHHLSSAPDAATLLLTQLPRPLYFQPGTSQEYSNLGYLILSMIIEKVTGEPYEDWMQENILRPAGCVDFHIAGNYYADKYPNETRYYLQDDDEPVEEYTHSGKEVLRCYGGNDIAGLKGAGAWVASTPELARFVAAIDGMPWVPDVLSQESIDQMTRYVDENTYSLGWNDTTPGHCWSRTGTLSGTSALIRLFPDGECWVMVANTSTWKGPRQTGYTAELFKRCREKCSASLPARDFFFE
ncbi:MAG: beta-lactamase family protein [Bacteroidales bacterium]|nr:beta-lactamase family protein [Bacteroidales bacterium]